MSVVDRDVLARCASAGASPIVVTAGATGTDWVAIGAVAELDPDFDGDELMATLLAHAEEVDVVGPPEIETSAGVADMSTTRVPALLVGVCGSGGAGVSTAAMAVAQGLAATASPGDDLVLADLALHADLAVLHDVGEVDPGIQELVEVARVRQPSAAEVRAMTWHVVDRRYHVLLGLRRSRAWTTIRPRAFDAALRSLRDTYDTLVCDLTGEVEGEPETGSADVGDRHLMARTVLGQADVVLVVGQPGVKGIHGLLRLLADLGAFGVPAGRIVPVVNRAPRSPLARSELTRTIAELSAPLLGGGHTSSPVFLPTRRVDEAIRDGVALPPPLPELLAGAVRAVIARVGPAQASTSGPDPVPVGAIGTLPD